MNCTTAATVSVPASVGDVDAFDRPRPLVQVQHLPQAGQPALRVDGKDLGLDVRFQLAALVERFEHLDFVAQPGRPPRSADRSAAAAISSRISASSRFLPPSRNRCKRWMSLRYSSFEMRKLHGAVHWAIECSRQGRNHRQRGSLSSMSSVQVRNLKIFCSTWIAPRSPRGLANGP